MSSLGTDVRIADVERRAVLDRPPAVPDFVVPPALEASAPPETRGLARDDVRLMVSRAGSDDIAHARFRDLPSFLERGDLLVVNASATLPAAVHAVRTGRGGEPVALHFSSPVPYEPTRSPAVRWVVEPRRLDGKGTAPLRDVRAGETLQLPGAAAAVVLEPLDGAAPRLWIARLSGVADVHAWLSRHGRPIRYPYVAGAWPLAAYQTMFARAPGSAEMPSAGRAFTPDVVAALRRRGVRIESVVLHAGVASLEAGEAPYAERYRVTADAAAAVNATRAAGGRVIAVGTTVVRALETVADADGRVTAGEGWSDLVVTPGRGLHAVAALLTGFHEPRATHLALLAALAGERHVEAAYRAALRRGYLWHEFGDLHLLFGP